jgi:glycosyl hydrolase family 30
MLRAACICLAGCARMACILSGTLATASTAMLRALRATAWLLAPFLLLEGPALADSGRVVPLPAQVIRGWGMSLAWEANDLYGGGRQPAQIKDPELQGQYLDLLYGDPATRLTLGFNVARYNIGGGDDPTRATMRADAQMEGFQAGPAAVFDWTRDAAQRRMLQEAKHRGADIFEAFSVSPPQRALQGRGCRRQSAADPHQEQRALSRGPWQRRHPPPEPVQSVARGSGLHLDRLDWSQADERWTMPAASRSERLQILRHCRHELAHGGAVGMALEAGKAAQRKARRR